MPSLAQARLSLLSSKAILIYIIVTFSGVLLVMNYTSPIELGPSGMLAAFAVYYAWFFALFMGLAHVIRVARYRSGESDDADQSTAISGRAVMLAAVWGFAPLVVVALQSIGQLDVISIGLVLLFEAIASIYIIKR